MATSASQPWSKSNEMDDEVEQRRCLTSAAPFRTPVAAPSPWALLLGATAAVLAGGAWYLLASDAWPTVVVSVLAVGLMVGLAVWLAADWANDRRLLRQARSGPRGEAGPGRQWLRRRLPVRYGAAGLAALCGAAAAFVRLTPDRVLKSDVLTLGFPVLVGLLVAAAGATAALMRGSAWEKLFDDWKWNEDVGTPPPERGAKSKQDLAERSAYPPSPVGTVTSPGSVVTPNSLTGSSVNPLPPVSLPGLTVTTPPPAPPTPPLSTAPPPPAPPKPPEWTPPTPPSNDDNDARG